MCIVRIMERTIKNYVGKGLAEILKNIIHQLHFGCKKKTRNDTEEKKVILCLNNS